MISTRTLQIPPFVFILFFSISLLPVQGQIVEPNKTGISRVADSLGRQVDSLFADYDTTGSPGAVVGVMRDGELVFAKGYGMADITHNIPITPQTRFNIASISKQFTGFGFAMLADRGKLALDDPVRQYLPDLPEFDHTVTLRHMLTHTSGYREAYGTLALRGLILSRDHLPREETLQVIERQPALEYIPGTNWEYNSTAYVVLAMILEDITGKSFPSWMQKQVFEPIGMSHTVIEDEVGQVIPNAATSYYYDQQDHTYTMAFSNRAIFGSAEMYTTVGDLIKWMQNFHTADVGGKQVQQMLRTPFVLKNGDKTHYGLGISVDRERGLKRVHHSGGHAAYGSKLNYYPEINSGVVVMANHGNLNAGRKTRKIARIFFGQHMDSGKDNNREDPFIELESDWIDRYTGRYESKRGEVISITKRNNALLVERSPINRHLLRPVSQTEFQTSDKDLHIIFQNPGNSKQATKATINDTSRLKVTRIPSFTPTYQELKKFSGRYMSPELETIYSVSVRDSQLVVRHRLLGTLRLSAEPHALRPGTFATDDGTIQPTLVFEQNKMNQITGFYANLWGTRNVWFQRME